MEDKKLLEIVKTILDDKFYDHIANEAWKYDKFDLKRFILELNYANYEVTRYFSANLEGEELYKEINKYFAIGLVNFYDPIDKEVRKKLSSLLNIELE